MTTTATALTGLMGIAYTEEEVHRMVEEHLKIDVKKRDEVAALEQGTPEWLASRVLRLTVSNAASAVGNSPYEKPKDYAMKLAGLTPPLDPDSYEGKRMAEACKWGHDNEDKACEAYAMHLHHIWEAEGRDPATFPEISFSGLVVDLERPWLGASPDGYVGDDGLIEIKCPKKGVVYPEMPPQYHDQVIAQMAITGRKWCDFVVWTESNLNVWRFDFDRDYWENWLLPRLEAFYFDLFLPLYVGAVVEGKALTPKELVERCLNGKPTGA